MLITKIDEYLNEYLDKLNIFLNKKKIINVIKKEENFVSYQNEIINTIKEYIESQNEKELKSILNNKSHCNIFYDVLKRYTAYYIYLMIGYYYKHGKENYITNLIDTSKEQHNSKYVIPQFFNSENNIQVIQYFMDIQNIKYLYERFGNSIENINNFLKNDPINYKSIILFFNELEEEDIVKSILIDNNIHNILKIIIFRFIYLVQDKQDLLNLLNEELEDTDENNYVYIDITREKDNKLLDISIIKNTLDSINKKADIYDIYDMFKSYIDRENNILKSKEYMRYLLENKILIPITEDILRYNKNIKIEETTERNDTRIKLILKYLTNIQHYSFDDRDKNLKIKAEQMIYKPLKHRNAITYNDVNELKTLIKLKNSNTDEYEKDIMKLEDIRKYNYINYKYISKDGFNIRLYKPVECIRYTNILYKKSNKKIETRMASESVDINIVGLAWNPQNLDIYNQNNSLLVNIQDEFKDTNNYENLKKKIDSKENKIYYWLFDNKNDFIETDNFVNRKVTTVSYIYSLLEDFYINAYVKNVYNDFKNNIDKIESINLWQLNNLLLYYDKLIDFNFSLYNYKIKDKIINYILTNKLIKNDMKNILEPYNPLNKRNFNKLPIVKIEKIEQNIIEINKDEEIEIIEELETKCIHYKKLYEIRKQKDFTAELLEFIQRYAMKNEYDDFICKSCNDLIDLRNYTIEGSFNEEVDKFIVTTDIIKRNNLTELDKYNKYPRTYKEINKSFERLVTNMNLERFIGATTFKNYERKYIIKDVIDLFLVTQEYKILKTTERTNYIEKTYKINKNLTELFFFDLEDDIFLIDSKSIDKFKIRKQNNVLIYLLFILILELNDDNIANLSVSEKYNYIIFNQFKERLFGNVYLRLDEKRITNIIKYPILCYLIYYMSSVLVYKNIWLNNEMKKLKPNDNLNIKFQIIAINTLMDFINFIVEKATVDDKSKLNSIYRRFKNRLETTLNNDKTIEKISNKSNYYIKKDNKIQFKKFKSIEFVDNKSLTDIKTIKQDNIFSNKCIITTVKINKKKDNIISGYNPIINCSKKLYHKYIEDDNDLVCTYCNEKYSDLLKKFNNKNDNYSNYKNIIKKMKLLQLSNLMTKYCISGTYHEIDKNDSVCKKCNKDTKECDFNNNDIENFKNKFNDKLKKKYEKFVEQTKKLTNNIIKNNELRNETMSEFNEDYNKKTLKDLVNAFISKLVDNLNNKTKSIIDKKTLCINKTRYIINHNHLGYVNKELIFINKEDNLVKLIKNNEFFKMDVYEYTFKKISTYYNATNYQYVGYRDKNEYVRKTADVYLIIDYSIKDKLLKLGLSKDYYEIKSLNKSIYNKGITNENIDIVIKDLIRERNINLKNIINRIKSILYKISNKNVLKTDSDLIKQYNNLIDNIVIINKKNNKKILTDSFRILNNIKIENIKNNEYFNDEFINTSILKYFSNADTKILYYIVHNLNNILIYNQNNKNISDISNLLVEIINTEYNNIRQNINNQHYKLFNYIFDNDKEDTISSNIKYELVTDEKTYDELVEEDKIEEQQREEETALDIDDYDTDEENELFSEERYLEE